MYIYIYIYTHIYKATGIVKSFSEKNGYGFINVPGQQVGRKQQTRMIEQQTT